MVVELKYSVQGAVMRDEAGYKKRPEKEGSCMACYGL